MAMDWPEAIAVSRDIILSKLRVVTGLFRRK